MPYPFVLTAITADPEVAAAADEAGVDRVGIDIERIGKRVRQGHVPGARISSHQLEDIAEVAARLSFATPFLRLNPFHGGTRSEVERALEMGARALMLPYFTCAGEVSAFVEMTAGRACPILLLETAPAVERLSEILKVEGVEEVVVGLNDLHLSLGFSSIFEVVVSGVMEAIAARVHEARIRFGFGGLARHDDGTLPVPPDLVYAQYPRLGARSAWLARSFFAGLEANGIADAVRALRDRMNYWGAQPLTTLAQRRANLKELLDRQREQPA
jgi:2-keto-3-deoxy-L-rhamnonate aldolase RhmA